VGTGTNWLHTWVSVERPVCRDVSRWTVCPRENL